MVLIEQPSEEERIKYSLPTIADLGPFFAALRKAMSAIAESGPWFLRTGMTSGKHGWKDCCFLDHSSKLEDHVAHLVEFSALAQIIGLPTDVWAVREFLPTSPVMALPRYGDMPLTREYRGFIRDGAVACVHPYWPVRAIRDGFGSGLGRNEAEKRARELFNDLYGEISEDATVLLRHTAEAFCGDGAWSVDVLETTRGWYVTDMAEAHRSFHYEGCENEEGFKK
jgi:hypothetical protein